MDYIVWYGTSIDHATWTFFRGVGGVEFGGEDCVRFYDETGNYIGQANNFDLIERVTND